MVVEVERFGWFRDKKVTGLGNGLETTWWALRELGGCYEYHVSDLCNSVTEKWWYYSLKWRKLKEGPDGFLFVGTCAVWLVVNVCSEIWTKLKKNTDLVVPLGIQLEMPNRHQDIVFWSLKRVLNENLNLWVIFSNPVGRN